MRTLAFDGRMGASGDMLLGALVAAGADPAVLDPVEDALDIEYEFQTTTRGGIEATDAAVLRPRDGERSDTGESVEEQHDHAHSHDEADDHAHAEGASVSRSFAEVVEIVESMGLSVEADAIATFELLGEAEASVHGTRLAETQFHEVGTDDAIADVVGALLLLDDLDPERVVTTPVAAGGGDVETSHGVYPVPAPAVTELAAQASWSVRGGPVEAELLTPTGAAILAHTATGVETLPTLDVEASGYGAGDRTFERHPNVLRALVGDALGDLQREAITVLETNLDDATPEALGGLHETLQDAGALDVTVLPTTMKKSRPGHLVKVVVAPENARRVARELATETGTLGVREHGAGHRFVADREQTSVTVDVGGERFEVGVKLATIDGETYDVSGEFDDALAVARETDRPVREVLYRAERAARDQLER